MALRLGMAAIWILTVPLSASAQDTAAPRPEESASLIQKLRRSALEYSASLPDFLCTQLTRRYTGSVKKDKEPTWKLLDTLTIQLSFFNQKEDYRVILRNQKPVDKTLRDLPGIKVRGDFGGVLRSVFRPESKTTFEWHGTSVVNNRNAVVFACRIQRADSPFGTSVQKALGRMIRTTWGVTGLIYADAESGQVLRLTLDSTDMPELFASDEVHLAVDYGARTIDGQDYLLPLKSLTTSKTSGKASRFDTEFTDYRKFSADTQITYGNEAKP